jgi:hypothetical protein
VSFHARLDSPVTLFRAAPIFGKGPNYAIDLAACFCPHTPVPKRLPDIPHDRLVFEKQKPTLLLLAKGAGLQVDLRSNFRRGLLQPPLSHQQ